MRRTYKHTENCYVDVCVCVECVCTSGVCIINKKYFHKMHVLTSDDVTHYSQLAHASTEKMTT